MHVRILGSAAGGGFPQWNCACQNCRLVRKGQFAGKARSQTQVALSQDGRSWFLPGASPDLRMQIENSPELHPMDGVRVSPVSGVVLPGADVDQTLGLLLLRELQPFHVYATNSVTRILRERNSMFRMLNRVKDQVRWRTIRAGESFPLCPIGDEPTGITCMPLALSSRYPAYVDSSGLAPEDAVLGLILTSPSGKKLAYLPSVASVSDELRAHLNEADLLLFDGTFYSDDELVRLQRSGQHAHEMGHMAVGGKDGSLHQLATLKKPRKLYIHINNTNPMLNEAGPEYRAVREAGWELAEDGWQTTL
jgi:pyrroloquinoline quinone biosynthesis protein B